MYRASTFRAASVSIIALAIGALSAPAAAQETAPVDEDQAVTETEEAQPVPQDPLPEATAQPEAAEGDEIVVTGTRILRPALTSPNPITSVDSESILLSGETNLTDYLQQIPALAGSVDSAQTSGSAGFIGSTGLNLLNLRNLGIQRTLVLVDGRRHVAQLPETAAVDIGTIPQDLISRIDVATGGVSAVYGADAVSGVVNFIMKKDFEGIIARGQIGVAEEGEPLNGTASLTAGMNFAGGRGNIAGSVQYTHEGRLRAIDRSYLRSGAFRNIVENPNDPNDDPNVPDQVALPDIRFFDSAREGAIDVGSVIDGVFVPGEFDGVPDLLPDGSAFDPGLFIPPFYQQGGSGTPRADYIGDVLANNDRLVANVFANYEFADWARFFAEVKYAHGDAFSESQPSFDFFTFYAPDNPLIPEAIREAAEAAGGLLLSRDNFDLGVRGEDNDRDTWRGVVGLNGNITNWLRYEASYTYGKSKVKSLSTNNRFNDRFFAAQDVVVDPATGELVCRITLDPTALPPGFEEGFTAPDGDGIIEPGELSFTPGPNSGCVPLNLFGEGVASQAAIDFVMTDSLLTSKLTQDVANAFVSGSVPGFELPGGPIGFVLGAEYRKETSRSTPPPEDTAGLTFGNVIFPVEGEFDVKEAFAEIRAPILKDRPFFEDLEVSGALRLSDYSTVGGTTTWNLGARWAPVRDVSFRGTYAQTVRAPNIAELFAPQSQDFEFITDPCDIENVNNGASTRPANCAAILSALGIDPQTFIDPNSSTVAGLQRGNETLSEETARSWTIGAVLRPRVVPGLSVTVDWYDIKIKDAINTATAEEIAENCVDQPTIDNVFCAGIERDPETGGIVNFIQQPENVANFRTAGLDFDINYRLDPAALGMGSNLGEFNLRLLGNYLHKLTFIPSPGAELDDDRTEQFAPKWQATFDLTWTKGPWTANYGFNYFSKTKRFSLEDIEGDPDLASPETLTFNARHTHDLQVAYDLFENFRIYAGGNNLTDQKPDVATFYPVSPIGRFFYVGARVQLPKIL